ncbi:MAG: iron-sulfur cluster loop [Candidatus Methanomethylicia archaeon]|nr:iron-sulfur cluster loop [Candidatus Methanomethylicia archaeon]
MPLINVLRILNVSRIVKNISIMPLNVFDLKFYLRVDESIDRVLSFFLIMVAMDHRLSRPGRPYETVIDGETYRGADLLYYLGARKFEEDPEFFTPKKLAFISCYDVIKWLSVGNLSPPDPELRMHLLNDIGVKSIKLFNGDYTELLKFSEGFLRRRDGYGFLDLLKVFKAYQDPVEKKSHLLIKFLVYRGLFKPLDLENLEVAVDNHLTRVAIRLGFIELEKDLLEKIHGRIEVSHNEDVIIRLCSREAYKLLSKFSGVNTLLLDDMFWIFGRTICTYDNPKCKECRFKNVCKAYENDIYLTEHTYINTWYY